MSQQQTVDRYRSARSHPKWTVLEGFHPLKHALRFDAEVLEALSPDPDHVLELAETFAPDIRRRLEDRLTEISDALYQELSPYPPDSSVIARAERLRVTVDSVLADSSSGPIVVLEEPADLGNLGAVVRVAAAAEAGGVLTTGRHDPWHPSALRGSAGLHYAVPVAATDRVPECDRRLVAFDPGGAPVDTVDFQRDDLLVFGSERRGLGEPTVRRADLRVRLPMRAGVSSLNLATSVAAVLYGCYVCSRGG